MKTTITQAEFILSGLQRRLPVIGEFDGLDPTDTEWPLPEGWSWWWSHPLGVWYAARATGGGAAWFDGDGLHIKDNRFGKRVVPLEVVDALQARWEAGQA
jgi:hypothetical protein